MCVCVCVFVWYRYKEMFSETFFTSMVYGLHIYIYIYIYICIYIYIYICGFIRTIYYIRCWHRAREKCLSSSVVVGIHMYVCHRYKDSFL